MKLEDPNKWHVTAAMILLILCLFQIFTAKAGDLVAEPVHDFNVYSNMPIVVFYPPAIPDKVEM